VSEANHDPSASAPPPPSMADVLALPDGPRELALWLLRKGEATLTEAAVQAKQPEAACQAMLQMLIDRGVVMKVEEGEACKYKARTARKRGSRIPTDLL
jgi:Sugar-specific transcriptional regulator TrmB